MHNRTGLPAKQVTSSQNWKDTPNRLKCLQKGQENFVTDIAQLEPIQYNVATEL